MDRFDDDTLIAELRELRPTPRPEWKPSCTQRFALPPRPSATV